MSNHTDLPSNNEDSIQNMTENTANDLSQSNIEATANDSVEDITLENDLAIEEFFAPSGSAQLAVSFVSTSSPVTGGWLLREPGTPSAIWSTELVLSTTNTTPHCILTVYFRACVGE